MEQNTTTNLPPISAFTSSRPLLDAVAALQRDLALLPEAERDAEALRALYALQSYANDAISAVVAAQTAAASPADGGTFIYHLGMTRVRRAYYDVLANSEEEAVAKLRAFSISELSFAADISFVTEDDQTTDDPGSVGDAVTITCASCKSDLEDEVEAQHDCDACPECGRSGDAPHTADCEIALAQDFEDGTITEGYDSYGDARAAHERLTHEKH